MNPKNIDLANKCGSCCWFKPLEGTCSGACLRNKYGDNVVHDPEQPYWVVQRSRIKCADYNRKPVTNADHIRSMTDEELAVFLEEIGYDSMEHRSKYWMNWLKQPYKEDT